MKQVFDSINYYHHYHHDYYHYKDIYFVQDISGTRKTCTLYTFSYGVYTVLNKYSPHTNTNTSTQCCVVCTANTVGIRCITDIHLSLHR